MKSRLLGASVFSFASISSTLAMLSSVAAALFLGFGAPNAAANLIFSNLHVTPTSFSVDISGTVPDVAVYDPTLFVFESNPISTSPGWVSDTAGFINANVYSFSGAQTSSHFTIGTPSWGDYIYHRFDSPLVADEIVSGTLFGRWGWSDAFDPSAVSPINVYWGGTSVSINRDISLVGTINTAVPIPPALYLFSSGLIGLIGMARRKKTKHSHCRSS